MTRRILTICATITVSLFLNSCGPKQPNITINSDTVSPGTLITRGNIRLSLLGNPIEVGQHLPTADMVDAKTMSTVRLNNYLGKVLFLSIVPSLDTKICEVQTHYLGEKGDKLPAEIVRFTVSRDTPFAQTRFAEEANLTDIVYLSDYKTGSFGQSTGLLIDGSRLLARSIIIADRQGVVRYIQVVPELSNLPDMEKAFAKAIEITKLP